MSERLEQALSCVKRQVPAPHPKASVAYPAAIPQPLAVFPPFWGDAMITRAFTHPPVLNLQSSAKPLWVAVASPAINHAFTTSINISFKPLPIFQIAVPVRMSDPAPASKASDISPALAQLPSAQTIGSSPQQVSSPSLNAATTPGFPASQLSFISPGIVYPNLKTEGLAPGANSPAPQYQSVVSSSSAQPTFMRAVTSTPIARFVQPPVVRDFFTHSHTGQGTRLAPAKHQMYQRLSGSGLMLVNLSAPARGMSHAPLLQGLASNTSARQFISQNNPQSSVFNVSRTVSHQVQPRAPVAMPVTVGATTSTTTPTGLHHALAEGALVTKPPVIAKLPAATTVSLLGSVSPRGFATATLPWALSLSPKPMLDFQIKKEMFLMAQAQTVLPYLPNTEEMKLIQEPRSNERHALIQEEKNVLNGFQVTEEAVTLIVSKKGWCQVRHGHGYESAQFQFRAGDALYSSFECHVADYLIAIASNGRVYSLAVSSLLAGWGDEQSLSSMMELEAGTSLMHFYAGAAQDRLLLATTNGYGFSARVGDMCSSLRIGKHFMNLDEGALPLAPRLISNEASALACLSNHLRLLVFGLDEIKPQALGGRGVILQQLEPQEKLLAALPISYEGLMLSTSAGGQEQLVTLSGAALALYHDQRGSAGRALNEPA